MLPNSITIVITHLTGKIKCQYLKITYPSPGPYRNPQAPDLAPLSPLPRIPQATAYTCVLRPAPEGSDKLVHLVAFAALAFPLARTGRFGLLPVFIGASAFGGAIELIQPSFNRSADVNDWVADIVGVILGIGLGLLYRRLRGN